MQRLIDRQESFMWVAELEDGTKIEEFDVEGKEVDFFDVQQKENLKTFGITDTNNTLTFDTSNGVFDILKNKLRVEVIDKDSKNLIETTEKRNNLIMFRTNEQGLLNGKHYDFPILYAYGFKQETKLLHFRVFVSVTMREGMFLNIDITPKENFIGGVKVFNGDKVLASSDNTNTLLEKGKKNSIKIKISA